MMKKIMIPLTIIAICNGHEISGSTQQFPSDLINTSHMGSYAYSPLGTNQLLKSIQLILSPSEPDHTYQQSLEKIIGRNTVEIIQQDLSTLSPLIESRTYTITDRETPLKDTGRAMLSNIGNIPLDATFSDPSATANLINQKVSDDTQGIIPNLLEANDISANTRLILLNTIVAKAAWKQQLTPLPEGLPFKLSDQEETTVRASYGTIRCFLYEQTKMSFIGLETKNSNLQMVFKLSKSGYTATPISLEELVLFKQHRGELQKVMLELPHGFMNPPLDLKKILSPSLSILEPNKSFLTILFEEKTTISALKQITTVEWDEKGLIGAAATSAVVGGMSMSPGPKPKEITLDRPFSFAFIQETEENPIIIFEGCVRDEDGLIPHHEPKHPYGCNPITSSSNSGECD